MTPIEPGQVWSIVAIMGGRTELSITRIEPPIAHGVTPAGRALTIEVRTLAKHFRGARLLRNADGSEPYSAPASAGYRAPAREKRSASDLVRTTSPRGVKEVNPRHRAIAQAVADGEPAEAIGARLGVTARTVTKIAKEVRDADVDARVLARMKGTG